MNGSLEHKVIEKNYELNKHIIYIYLACFDDYQIIQFIVLYTSSLAMSRFSMTSSSALRPDIKQTLVVIELITYFNSSSLTTG